MSMRCLQRFLCLLTNPIRTATTRVQHIILYLDNCNILLMGLRISFHDPIKSIKSCPLSAEALQYLVIPPRKKKSKCLSMVYKAWCHLTLTLTMFPLPDYDCPGLLSFSFGGQCLMSQETTEGSYALCPFCFLSAMLLPHIWGWLPPSHHSTLKCHFLKDLSWPPPS